MSAGSESAADWRSRYRPLRLRSRAEIQLQGQPFFRRVAVVGIVAAAWAASVWAQGPPRVTGVDPPDWWAPFTPQIMLLVTGKNLSGATATLSQPGVMIVRQKTPNADHIFVWLAISGEARPGLIHLRLRTNQGSADVPFELHAPISARGNFQGFSGRDCIYLIMPDRFADGDTSNDQPPQSPGTFNRGNPRAYHGGDLRGIEQHLPYLRDLGVTALWLTPIYDNDNHSPQDYHGYGAVNYYAVDEHFGTLGDFQRLVQAAHRQGIKIILDQVPNHTGPKHPWVTDLPEPNWFHGTPEHHRIAEGRFGALIDPHAAPRESLDLLDGWFANLLPDLNQENPDVATYLIQNSLWWAESSGLDGFRLDTFPYVPRRFWSAYHRALGAAFPLLTTVGEVFNGDPSVTSFFMGGATRFDGIDSGLTTVFDFPAAFALHDCILKGAPFSRLVSVLERDWLYPHPERLVTFFDNHDLPRFITLAKEDQRKLELAYSLLFTLRGIPEIYYGDEIGMQGGDDPDNRRDFPGGFPGDSHDAFTAAGRTADEQRIFNHVRSLLALRREHPALRRGQQVELAWDRTYYAFVRQSAKEKLLIVANNSNAVRTLDLPLGDTPLHAITRLQPLFDAQAATVNDRKAGVTVQPRSVAIYRAE